MNLVLASQTGGQGQYSKKKMHAFQKVTDQVTDGPTNQATD